MKEENNTWIDNFGYAPPPWMISRRWHTHNGFSVQVPTQWNIKGCQGSNWLYAFKGIRPFTLSFNVITPSRNFVFVIFDSRPTIFAPSQLIGCSQVVLCFANPPSPVFIRSVALSMLPSGISSCVSRTVFICSFRLVIFGPFHQYTNTFRIHMECATPRSCSCLPAEFSPS